MNDMVREIREQPDWIERALELEQSSVQALVRAMSDRDIKHVIIAARGTSDNAATYAKYLFEIVAGIPVALAAPSVYTLYDATPAAPNTLVMGISQSGQGTDVVHVLAAARKAGALTACITNSRDSAITRVSEHTLLCRAGDEKAVAATKTYTTSLAVVALLVASLTRNVELQEGLAKIPQAMRSALDLEEYLHRAVERYRYMEECAVLARGINQATALETALKLTETCYILAKPYSGADFLHGPIAMVDAGFPCLLFAPEGKAFASQVDLAHKLTERGAELIVIAASSDALEAATTRVQIPITGIPELLSPLPFIVPGQLFAYHLSRTRGNNPDAPRGLNKVTLTR